MGAGASHGYNSIEEALADGVSHADLLANGVSQADIDFLTWNDGDQRLYRTAKPAAGRATTARAESRARRRSVSRAGNRARFRSVALSAQTPPPREAPRGPARRPFVRRPGGVRVDERSIARPIGAPQRHSDYVAPSAPSN